MPDLPDRHLTRGTLESMLAVAEPEWRLLAAELATDGYLAVYHLDVATPQGGRRVVLKASPDGENHGIPTEARILAVLVAHTDVPVPSVEAAVDAHDDAPTPFFLMDALPGAPIRRPDLPDADPRDVARIARQVGEHLGAVHRVDAVDAFGYVTASGETTCRGGRPSSDPGGLTVAEATDSWRDHLRESASGVLLELEDGPFADLVPGLRTAVDDSVGELEPPFTPVLAHIDCQLGNVLYDRDTGRVTGMLDWAFTAAATPAYDLVFVEHSLAGGPWWWVPETPDYRDTIRRELRRGYATSGDQRALERYDRYRDAYQSFECVHTLLHAEDRLRHDGATDDQVGAAHRALRDWTRAVTA